MKDQAKASNPPLGFDLMRDAYGFAVRQQHVQRYREYANIYKEEEEERSDRWESFLDRLGKPARLPVNGSSVEETRALSGEATDDILSDGNHNSDVSHDDLTEEGKQSKANRRIHRIQIWTETRPSLRVIEDMMNVRVKNKANQLMEEHGDMDKKSDLTFKDINSEKGVTEEDSEDEFYDVERSDDPIPDVPPVENVAASVTGATDADEALQEDSSWKEELEVLVRGGVPMALRGELWQAFVGVKARRMDKYYQDLLASETCSQNHAGEKSENGPKSSPRNLAPGTEKWKGQIEKVITCSDIQSCILDSNNICYLLKIERMNCFYSCLVGLLYTAFLLLTRICLVLFLAILPWILMAEMLLGGYLQPMHGITPQLDTARP